MIDPDTLKSLEELAREMGKYPVEAFNFVREGLKYTVQRESKGQPYDQHISGKELCWGLRDFALRRWGFLAPMVLRRWNICSTLDFGQIVFAMVEAGWMAKKDNDTINDFRNVFDFRNAFKDEIMFGDSSDSDGMNRSE